MSECNCCVYKAIQNCPLRMPKPLLNYFEDEKLINIQHIENDLKMYEFYRKLFLKNLNIHDQSSTSVWCGDRVEQLGDYYVYCYEYSFFRPMTGEREIRVGVFDWKRQAFVAARIVCGIYPGKYYKKYGLNLNRVRTVITILRCSTVRDAYTSTSAKRDIENVLDSLVAFFIHDPESHEEKIHQTILRRFNICASIRLIQFLKYAIRLQTTVKKYCMRNCTCGGFGGECICPVVINTCFQEFPDAKRMHSDEVFFGTPWRG